MDLLEFQRRIEIYVENELPSLAESRVAVAAALAPKIWPLVNQWQATATSTSEYVRSLAMRLLDDWPLVAAQLGHEETASPSGWWPEPHVSEVTALPLADGSWSIAGMTYLPGNSTAAPRLLVTAEREGEVRTIRFDGVEELEFVQETSNMPYTWIVESIDDRGWEVLKYEISTGVDGAVRFFCAELSVIGSPTTPTLTPRSDPSPPAPLSLRAAPEQDL
jgi:hypothetical protein